MSVFILATLDTKGPEAELVRTRLAELDVATQVVDVGCLGTPAVQADIPREEVFRAANASLEQLRDRNDRGQAVATAAIGATHVVSQAFAAGRLTGVIGLGGSAGTTIATAAMRALPIGVPKVMISTLASGQVRPYVGEKDILMLNSIVDICGINRVTRSILNSAAAAMAGMVRFAPQERSSSDKPLIAATMFGVTTPCVRRAREILESEGYEVLVFHATGSGGRAMESLIEDDLIAGVLDITTTELADHLVGGVFSAGPERLTAATRKGVPQLVSVGALDMVNFGARDTIPTQFADRKFYQHNATVTLMRTTVDENAKLGEELGSKVARSAGPALILLPAHGVSAIDAAGEPFNDPDARSTLYGAIRKNCGGVEVREMDCHINDPKFAETAARSLLQMIVSKSCV